MLVKLFLPAFALSIALFVASPALADSTALVSFSTPLQAASQFPTGYAVGTATWSGLVGLHGSSNITYLSSTLTLTGAQPNNPYQTSVTLYSCYGAPLKTVADSFSTGSNGAGSVTIFSNNLPSGSCTMTISLYDASFSPALLTMIGDPIIGGGAPG